MGSVTGGAMGVSGAAVVGGASVVGGAAVVGGASVVGGGGSVVGGGASVVGGGASVVGGAVTGGRVVARTVDRPTVNVTRVPGGTSEPGDRSCFLTRPSSILPGATST